MRPQIKFFAEELPDTMRLWVEDNGIGIAAEHHERFLESLSNSRGPVPKALV